MTDKVILYHRTKRGQVKVWSIWYDAKRCIIYRRWGIKDGKMQETKETIRAKQGLTAEARMLRMVENHIQSRIEQGYVLKLKNVRQSILIKKTDMRFDRLPLEFAPQKPVREFTPQKGRDYIYQRKRDGQRHYVLVDTDGNVRIYSRKMEDKTDHMPRLRRAIEDLNLPACTIIDGEVIVDRDGDDDFRATGTVCRANVARAARNEKSLPLKFMVFDLLFYSGQAAWQDPYHVRFAMILEIAHGQKWICAPQHFEDFDVAKKAVRKFKWEGLVAWDTNAPNRLQMNGKHVRHGCYKWKPLLERDFVAIGYLPGKGRLENTVGRLRIAEWQKGKLVEIGTCGSGLDDETRDKAKRWKYPVVVQLEYDKQEDDSRALRFPVFVRVHPDKTVEECK